MLNNLLAMKLKAKNTMCKLNKTLYGLKQAPSAWYSRIDAYLMDNGFDKCDGEPIPYIK